MGDKSFTDPETGEIYADLNRAQLTITVDGVEIAVMNGIEFITYCDFAILGAAAVTVLHEPTVDRVFMCERLSDIARRAVEAKASSAGVDVGTFAGGALGSVAARIDEIERKLL